MHPLNENILTVLLSGGCVTLLVQLVIFVRWSHRRIRTLQAR
jgi:hypothetical protein